MQHGHLRRRHRRDLTGQQITATVAASGYVSAQATIARARRLRSAAGLCGIRWGPHRCVRGHREQGIPAGVGEGLTAGAQVARTCGEKPPGGRWRTWASGRRRDLHGRGQARPAYALGVPAAPSKSHVQRVGKVKALVDRWLRCWHLPLSLEEIEAVIEAA